MNKTDERPAIAANLRTARIAAGFDSISDAARHIGIPVPTAVAHEGGPRSFRRPKLEQLRRYAQAYGTTIDALEGGTILPPPPRPAGAQHLVAVEITSPGERQQITLQLPTTYKVGDTITISGRITGVFRKL
jgi:transcriptional regulator with XRE-family HTH domain